MILTAFAASEPQISTTTTTVTAYSYSRFQYTIPATVDLTGGVNSFDVTLDSYSLDPNYEIVVKITNLNSDGKITMTCPDRQTLNETGLEIAYNGTPYTDGGKPIFTFTELGTKTINAQLDTDAPAGSWTGTIDFYLAAEPKA